MVKCDLCDCNMASPTRIDLICDHTFHRECLHKKKNKKICPVCHCPRQIKGPEKKDMSQSEEVLVVTAVNHNIIRISDGFIGSCIYDPDSGCYFYPPHHIVY